MKFVKVDSIPQVSKKNRDSSAYRVLTEFVRTGYKHASLESMPWKTVKTARSILGKAAKKYVIPVTVNVRGNIIYLTSNAVSEQPPIRQKRPYYRHNKPSVSDGAAANV